MTGPLSSRGTLPDGWKAFRSVQDGGKPGYWYATAPYYALPIAARAGKHGVKLFQTVTAPSWDELEKAVQDQVALYERLTAT